MSTLPYDYARCRGAYDPPLGSGYAQMVPQCVDCLRRTAPVQDHLTWYMLPPDFRPCPERVAP
jgi:hypothetical protein